MKLKLVTYIATDCFLQFENCLVVKWFFFLPLTELAYSILQKKIKMISKKCKTKQCILLDKSYLIFQKYFIIEVSTVNDKFNAH